MDNNSSVPEIDVEDSLLDLANKLVETADQLLKAALVLGQLTDTDVPAGSMLAHLLDVQKKFTYPTNYTVTRTGSIVSRLRRGSTLRNGDGPSLAL